MNHRGFLFGMLLLLAGSFPGLTVAEEGAHRKAVEQLFQLTRMEQKVDESVETMLQLQLRQNPRLAPYRDLLHAFLVKHIGWANMKEELAQMYLWEFTQQELEEMNTFYASPTGQKVIGRLPVLVQQRNQMAVQRIQQNIGDLQQQITKAAEQARQQMEAQGSAE